MTIKEIFHVVSFATLLVPYNTLRWVYGPTGLYFKIILCYMRQIDVFEAVDVHAFQNAIAVIAGY